MFKEDHVLARVLGTTVDKLADAIKEINLTVTEANKRTLDLDQELFDKLEAKQLKL